MAFKFLLHIYFAFYMPTACCATSSFFQGPSQISSYLLTDYDKFLHPLQLQGLPTKVELQPTVIEVESINAKARKVSFLLELNAKWIDERLAFANLNYSKQVSFVPYTDTKANGWQVWKPAFHWNICPKVQTRGYVYHVLPNGEVKYGLQLRLDCTCIFSFGRMPWNSQQCLIPMHAFGEQSTTVTFSGSNLHMEKELGVPDYKNIAFTGYTGEFVHGPAQMYRSSRMVLSMTFDPEPRGIIVSSLVPVMVFVFIALGSMYVTEHPARLALCIISSLIVNVCIGKVYGDLPSSSVKPWVIDFLYGCLFFNLSALFLAIVVDFSDTQVKVAKQSEGSLEKGLNRLWFKISNGGGKACYRTVWVVVFIIYLIVMFAIVGTYPEEFEPLAHPDAPGSAKEMGVSVGKSR